MSPLAAPVTNWAGNIIFSSDRLDRPASVEELQELVAGSDRVRVLGTGHSFNRIADTEHTLVSVAGLPPTLEVGRDRSTVTVSGGLRFGELCAELHRQGLALHNLGSLPHISLAGAYATGTHGSGDRNGTLASAVEAVELLRADGDLAWTTRADPDFAGTVVALGALGVVTRVVLAVEPAFDVHQVVYDELPMSRLWTDLDEIFGSAYSVSVFTDWSGPGAEVWRKARTGERPDPPNHWLGALLADGPRHPIPGMPGSQCTEQLGVPGPWHARLPHFRIEFTPSNGDELQSEYFVPRPAAAAAVEALYGAGDRFARVVQTAEIRTIAADDLWLSPSDGRDTVAFHFTWQPDAEAVAAAVGVVEEVLVPLNARPHWAKVFRMEPELVRERYPRSAGFPGLLDRFDPAGKFRNAYIDRYFPR
jgi:xylitol oxidase